MKTDLYGKVIWDKLYPLPHIVYNVTVNPENNDIYITSASLYGSDLNISLIISDKYAYKNMPFIWKIPVSKDSLNYSYIPISIPEEMNVTGGGTISWIPKTDSVYLQRVGFQIVDGRANIDTLSFNL